MMKWNKSVTINQSSNKSPDVYLNPNNRYSDISIIIGCSNGENDTLNCIKSILRSEPNNKHKIRKIFVHSNGSTDGTNEMLLKMQQEDRRIQPIFSDRPLGYARTFNFPMQFCETEFICCLNNDTEMFADWLDILMKPFYEENGIGISAVMWINEKENIVGGECYIVRKSTYAKIGLLNESFNIAYGEDHELSLRMHNASLKCFASAHTFGKDGGMFAIDFPMNHKSNQTTALFGNVHSMIDASTIKVNHLHNSQGSRLLFILKHKAQVDTLEQEINDLIAEDPECIILIISDNFLILDAVHNIGSVHTLKNVFIVPHIFGDGSKQSFFEVAGIIFNRPLFVTVGELYDASGYKIGIKMKNNTAIFSKEKFGEEYSLPRNMLSSINQALRLAINL